MQEREQPTTLRQVARQAGVSVATVSRVISGANPVSADTERRVRDAMTALSFSPNRLAQGLRSQQTLNVGLVLPEFTNQFFFELIAQTVSMAKSVGYTVLVTGDERPEDEALKLVRGRIVDGLVLVASRDTSTPTKLAHLDIPIVCFDRAPGGLACPVFRVDNVHGGALVADHLARQGARRIAHITGIPGLDASELRLDGYRRTLAAHGLGFDPDLVVEGDFTEASGSAALDRLLALPSPPDAIFAGNDLMGIGVLRRASERGLRVPGDLLVAGFDGLNAGRFTVPGLTTLAQPIAHLARQAVARLLDLVQAKELPARREVVTVEGGLVVRESTIRNRQENQ